MIVISVKLHVKGIIGKCFGYTWHAFHLLVDVGLNFYCIYRKMLF